MKKDSDIAIIGIGCMFPQAGDTESYWANVVDGVDAITELPDTHWQASDYFDADPSAQDMTHGRRGGFLDAVDFDPLAFGISPKDIDATDTSQLLGLVAAARALDDAGYGSSGKSFDRERISVVVGVTGASELVIPLGARLGHPKWRRALADAGVDEQTAQDVVERISASYVPWTENSFPGLLGNVVAGRIANRLDLHGTNCVVDAACASSMSALHLAMLELETGRVDMALSGGVDTFNDIFMYMCFSKTPALSPTGDVRPFASNGDGTILGEGVGIIALKRVADAERDGDRIYAVLRAMGSSSDGKGDAIYAPTAEGQARAIRRAYEQAGVDPASIELVEAHGTGTAVGDAQEIRGLGEVFGRAERPWCALGSVKSMIGHTKAAAGIAGVIKSALSVYHQVLPPTLKVEAPNPALVESSTPFYLNTKKRPWVAKAGAPRRAGVSSFGFGGSNFHCLIEEHDAPAEPDFDGAVQVLPFCGADHSQLIEALGEWQSVGDWPTFRHHAALQRETFANASDADRAHRLVAIVSREGQPPADVIRTALTQLQANPDSTWWSHPVGVYYGVGTASGPLAALFPGQGAQYVGMLSDLACRFPELRSAISDAGSVRGVPMVDYIYPPTSFSEDVDKRNTAALLDTAIAQPAIGAVNLGALAVIRRFGVEFSAATGHSYGELVALCAAGRLTPDELHRLSRTRGELMAGSDVDVDRGAMLAVMLDASAMDKFMSSHDLGLVVANHNAPKQVVLSGPSEQIEKARDLLAADGVECRKLCVSVAFHSPLVADACGPLGDDLDSCEFPPASFPVYANTTGAPYPEDPALARVLLAEQISRPVKFVDSIRAMVDAGIRTFVEVGPGARLTGLTREILSDQSEIVTVSLDASSGRFRGDLDLAKTLAVIAARGHEVDFKLWDPRGMAQLPAVPKLVIPVCGANTFVPTHAAPVVQPPVSVETKSAPAVQPALASAPKLAPATQVSHDNMAALIRLQEQTAELHRKFLEGQTAATAQLHDLLLRQQGLSGAAPIALPKPAMAPAPAVIAPAPATPVAPSLAEPIKSEGGPEVSVADSPSASVAEILLEVVADKTGYPVEMLDLSMGLDADLGIDSIKRVEILSVLAEQLPDAPEIKPEHLGTLETLGHIVEFLSAGMTAAPSSASTPRAADGESSRAAAAAQASSVASQDAGLVADTLLAVVSDSTGYPVEMLELSMGLDADLGIDSIKRVEILSVLAERLPDAPAIKPEHLGQLQTLGEIAEFLSTPPTSIDSASAEVDRKSNIAPAPAGNGQIRSLPIERFRPELIPFVLTPKSPSLAEGSLVWVTESGDGLSQSIAEALGARGLKAEVVGLGHVAHAGAEDNLAGLILVAPIVQPPTASTSDQLAANFAALRAVASKLRSNGGMAASVIRNDGGFGLIHPATTIGAGLAGLIKSAAWEWPEIHCRAIDVDPALSDPAQGIVEAMLSAGPVELGIGSDGVKAIGLTAAEPGVGSRSKVSFGTNDRVLITGGARGVTAELACALARSGGPSLVVVGRSPQPQPEPPELQGLEGAKALKAALAAALVRPTPGEIEVAYRRVIADREITANLARIRAEGSAVEYLSVDVRDAVAVTGLIEKLATGGAITGLVHGAGVIADRLIEDKGDEEMRAVFETKVDGLDNLLAALGDAPLKAIVVFSSTTARFGRRGQSDYAMANEQLNKRIGILQVERPSCRCLAVNWGPWDGGMVSSAHEKIFAAEGIKLVGCSEGADYLVAELASGDDATETVVVGANSAIDTGSRPLLAAGQAPRETENLSVVFVQDLNTDEHHFLRDHVIDGQGVLPLAIIIEWLAHAALHSNPGLRFFGIDDLRVLKGVRVAAGDRLRVRLCAGELGRQANGSGPYVVTTRLESGGNNGHAVRHASATIVLTDRADAAASSQLGGDQFSSYSGDVKSIYGEKLFHGSVLRGIRSVLGCGPKGISAQVKAASAPAEWMRTPVRGEWITDPMAIDCAFQLAILWCLEEHGRPSLPSSARRFRLFREFSSDDVRIVIRTRSVSEHSLRADIEWIDADGAVIAAMEDYVCTMASSLLKAFERNRLSAPPAEA